MKIPNNKGLALIEFILIISVILIIVLFTIFTIGGEIKDYITKASCAISNKEFIEGEKAGEAYCNSRK